MWKLLLENVHASNWLTPARAVTSTLTILEATLTANEKETEYEEYTALDIEVVV